MKLQRNKYLTITFYFILVLFLVGASDYIRVRKKFEKPLFAICTNEESSGYLNYKGLGYSFKIKGNFKEDDELKGVTHFEYYLLGKFITSGIRD